MNGPGHMECSHEAPYGVHSTRPFILTPHAISQIIRDIRAPNCLLNPPEKKRFLDTTGVNLEAFNQSHAEETNESLLGKLIGLVKESILMGAKDSTPVFSILLAAGIAIAFQRLAVDDDSKFDDWAAVHTNDTCLKLLKLNNEHPDTKSAEAAIPGGRHCVNGEGGGTVEMIDPRPESATQFGSLSSIFCDHPNLLDKPDCDSNRAWEDWEDWIAKLEHPRPTALRVSRP
ncbi:uncharacterized protein F5Z01DRAFT_496230 [Emericellopsis atlantica]|uniref:Uncharacterized protein n=1 Tax=Emericellopsis atlantica TaxID=2614577 RepID=A0A9P7ZC37_9HYPO|nr:uncharacterized protein F5Z01DRAFT_496230 [Emericellopsis atlantica]KAG9249443.1 hypothetical protein F5Z01DRAFT_496230 [Emericellopsis atlantica]